MNLSYSCKYQVKSEEQRIAQVQQTIVSNSWLLRTIVMIILTTVPEWVVVGVSGEEWLFHILVVKQ